MPNVFDFKKLLEAQREQSEAVAKLFNATKRVKELFELKHVVEKTINNDYMTMGKDIPVVITVSTSHDEFRQCNFLKNKRQDSTDPLYGFPTNEMYNRHSRCDARQARCPKVPILRV